MGETDVQRQFSGLASQYTGSALGKKCQLDLTEYPARSILSGLLIIISQEEANLLHNPQSQSELKNSLRFTARHSLTSIHK